MRIALTSALVVATAASLAAEAPWPPPGEEIAALFDEVCAPVGPEGRVPGAVCVMVLNGEAVFAKGYGVMDREGGEPVDAVSTVFRLASLSKVITAIAVMQQVEEGNLDLHTDVNAYLTAFQAPETFPEPITLAHLLTHSAGFDERFLRMAARTREERLPLGEYLAWNLPPRVMPPGEVMSYSNHGMALAGHLVEAVSGEEFADYARKHLFAPLGMMHSGFELTPELAEDLATGYTGFLGKPEPATYDYPQTVPASTLMSTGTDMARLMIAFLQGGEYEGTRILSEASCEAMLTRQFTHHPRMGGRTWGLSQRVVSGVRIVRHDGLIWGFKSTMVLIPEKQAGVFVSSSSDQVGLPARVMGRFVERFLPGEEKRAAPQVLPGFEERAEEVSGYYRNNRHVRSTFVRLGTIAQPFVEEVRVSRGPEPGLIQLDWQAFGSVPQRYLEIEPYFFRHVSGRDKETGEWRLGGPIAFRGDDAGGVTHLTRETSAYERLEWWEARVVLAGAAALCLLLALTACVGWPCAYVIRRVRRVPKQGGLGLHAARVAAGMAAGFAVAFAAGLGAYIATLNPYAFGYGVPLAMKALLVLPVVAALWAVPAAVFAVLAWQKRWWGLIARLHYTVVTAAIVLLLLILDYWNLLGFRFG